VCSDKTKFPKLEDAKIALVHHEQQKEDDSSSLKTNKKEARPTYDKHSFLQSIMLALASSPHPNCEQATGLGLPYSTTHHMFKHAKGVRSRLKNVEEAL
jgi:hypothetical protein